LENIVLAGGNSVTVSFRWTITGFNCGNYTIWAYVWPVQNEINVTNNTFNAGWAFVTMAADVTSATLGTPDGRVDMRDIAAIASRYGTTPASPSWSANVDVNDDDVINNRDIGIACTNFLKF
jgi:hypothetical protein